MNLLSLRGAAGSALILAVLAALLLASGQLIARANPHPGQSINVVVCCGDDITLASDVVNGGNLPVTGAAGELGDFAFSAITVANVSAASLASYDTVVLNVASDELDCDATQLSTSQKSDLVNFVGGGHKMVIYDSECEPQDYSWLPFPFNTNNPGAQGSEGTVNIVEENTLSSSDPADSHYIDAADLGANTDAIGDMNVMVTLDSNWCLDMSGTNVNDVTGPVHTYARFGSQGSVGLFIYNGMDVDYMGDATPDWLRKIWLQELQQPFNPDNLPCAVPVAGISLTPETATNNPGSTHAVTASVSDLLGNPSPDVTVTFSVTAGPNTGDAGQGITNTNGQATFTYTGDGGLGTDTIEACFLDQQEQEHCDTASKIWVQPTPTPTATATASATPTPTATALAVIQLPSTGERPAAGGDVLWLAMGITAAIAACAASALACRRIVSR